MTHINAVCLCGKVNQQVKLKSATLPVEEEICHCDACRRTTGSVGSMYISLAEEPVLDAVVGYASSELLTRYFCNTCGTHCFVELHDRGTWSADSGILEEIEPRKDRDGTDIIKITSHAYVDVTGDGGLAAWLTEMDNKEIPCYAESGEEGNRVKLNPARRGGTAPAKALKDDKLHVSCHCGGVQFDIMRSSTDPTTDTWWLMADGTKYRAQFCVCRSCRLAAGQPLQPWTYVEKKDMRTFEGTVVDFDQLGSLKQYQSSPRVWHDFCGKCGASAFYRSAGRSEESGFDIIDVSVGLLKAPEGVRAENWLEWPMDKVSWREDGLDNELIDALLAAK